MAKPLLKRLPNASLGTSDTASVGTIHLCIYVTRKPTGTLYFLISFIESSFIYFLWMLRYICMQFPSFPPPGGARGRTETPRLATSEFCSVPAPPLEPPRRASRAAGAPKSRKIVWE